MRESDAGAPREAAPLIPLQASTRSGRGVVTVGASPFGSTHDLDPRVGALVDWAQSSSEKLGETGAAALAALEQSPPRAAASPSLALIATAAYARVPTVGPRDLQTGHRIVELLGMLDEAGARELVRLRERASYAFARARIAKVLARQARELGTPPGELEDSFDGPGLDDDLTMSIEVGPVAAHLRVSGDLRKVRTEWIGARGRPVGRRPAQTLTYPHELELVETERRRLQSHLADLRARLERAMTEGRSWSVDRWTQRMFAGPLRAAMARRLIWRIEETSALALPGDDGLRDVTGKRVRLPALTNLSIWHPADSPIEEGLLWQKRLAELEIDQPIDQAAREVTAADPDSPTLRIGAGTRVTQRQFRGFLMNRGWHVPYLGSWFDVPEATFELLAGGPLAVLHLAADGDQDEVIVGELCFRSAHHEDLDARLLPQALVSDAARDVLGAVAIGTAQEPASRS